MSIDLIQIAVAIAGAVAGYLFRRPPGSPLLPGPAPTPLPDVKPLPNHPLPNHPLLDLLLQLLTERFRAPQAAPPATPPAAERLPVLAQADLLHSVQSLRQEVAALRAQQPAA